MKENSRVLFESIHLSRRTILGALTGAAVGATLPFGSTSEAADLHGRINQSVCLWCYDSYLQRVKMDLDGFAAACAKMGLRSIELTRPEQWPTLRKHGLICAMTGSHGIPRGLNRSNTMRSAWIRSERALMIPRQPAFRM